VLRLAVLSAPRQALVRGRGGSRFAARGHRGSQVLRRAACVTGLASEGLKTAWFSNWSGGARKTRSQLNPAQPTSHCFVASLKARCALSEGSEAQSREAAIAPARSSTPYTRSPYRPAPKSISKYSSVWPFVRPKAACSADLATTSYLLWQLVCSQWLGQGVPSAAAKRQPCCRTQVRTHLAAAPTR